MVNNCLNLANKEVKKLVETFGYVTATKILDEFYGDNNFTYDEVMSNSKITKKYGFLSRAEANRELGSSFAKQISNKGLINLKSKVSALNNRSKGVVYKLANVKQVGQADLYTWELRRFEGNLNVEAKLERAKTQDTGTIQSANKIKELETKVNTSKEGEQLSLFFNLNEPDKSREQINQDLNFLLKDILKKLRVVKNGEEERINIITLEEYKNQASARLGAMDNIGVADIIDHTIAYSEEDGVTLPEEALHFIWFVIKDTPEGKKLLSETDESGIPLFKKTKVYQNNFRRYMEAYDGDEARVNDEIAAKLLTQHMYDTRREARFKNRILKGLDLILNAILNRFKKQVKLSYKVDNTSFPIELRKILGVIDSGITSQQYFQDASKNKIIVPSPYSINILRENPAQRLRKVNNNLKQLIQQKKNILNALNNKGSDFKEYASLFAKSGLAEGPDEKVTSLTADRILKAIDEINNKLQVNASSDELLEKRRQLLKLLEYNKIFEKSNEEARIIRSLETRLKYVTDAIAQQHYEEGLNVFLFGSGNIKDKDYGDDYNIEEYGAIFDLYRASEIAKKYLAEPERVRAEHISNAKEILQLYGPILDIVRTYITSNNGKLFENDDLRNSKVNEALDLITSYQNTLEDFVSGNNKEIHYYAQLNTSVSEIIASGKNGASFFNKATASNYTELSSARRWMGITSEHNDAWFGVFQKKLLSIKNKIQAKFNSKMSKVFAELKALGYDKISFTKLPKVVFQHVDGERTFYFNTEYDIHRWQKAKKAQEQVIVEQLKAFVLHSKDKNINKIIIPDSYKDLRQLFEPVYHISDEVRKNLSPELKALWLVRDAYSEAWGAWHALNSENLPDVESIIATRKSQMSLYEFENWKKFNINEYTRSDGETVTYYRGELSRPGKDYVNKDYANLSTEEKKVADYFFEQNKMLKQELKLDSYSYEFYARVPQISKTTLDTITSKNMVRNLIDGITETFSSRVDDDIYNRDENDKIVRMPPIRYNRFLDSPKLLSTDPLRMLGVYMEMVEHRSEFVKHIPELQGMIDMVGYGKVLTKKEEKNKQEGTVGTASNLYKNMEYKMRTEVFGDINNRLISKTPFGVLDWTKIANFIRNYISHLNLAGNMTSAATSMISAEIDKITNSIIGDIISLEDYKYGQLKFTASGEALQMAADWEKPIKKYKINALAIAMQLTSDLREQIKDTHINRGVRMAVSVTKPFSLWNFTELPTVLPLIPAVANTYRKVNGIWYSKQQYKTLFRDKASRNQWKKAPNLYDSISMIDNEIDFADVPEHIIESFFITTQALAARMSQKLSSLDKGEMFAIPFVNWLTLHMGWLFQTVSKATKASHFNFQTNQWETGYYNGESFRFYARAINQFMKDSFRSAVGLTLDYKSFKEILDYIENPQDEAKIKNFYRVLTHMTTTLVLSMITFVLIGLSLGDDDDEEKKIDNVGLQLAALLSTKVMIEQNAKLSLKDLYNFAQNPTGNADRAFSIISLAQESYRAFLELDNEDAKKVKKGIYQDYNDATKQVLTRAPYVKGLLESYYGGYLNNYFNNRPEDEEISIALSYFDKRKGLEFFVLNEENQKVEAVTKTILGDGLIIPSRWLGYFLGSNLLKVVGNEYYHEESGNYMRLPTKKAKKNAEEEQNK